MKPSYNILLLLFYCLLLHKILTVIIKMDSEKQWRLKRSQTKEMNEANIKIEINSKQPQFFLLLFSAAFFNILFSKWKKSTKRHSYDAKLRIVELPGSSKCTTINLMAYSYTDDTLPPPRHFQQMVLFLCTCTL